jgi:hypothetical protein
MEGVSPFYVGSEYAVKAISTLLLGLSVSLLLNSMATADSFNNRDQHHPKAVTSNPQNSGMSGNTKSIGYEEGLYEDAPWGYFAPAGSPEPREPVVVQLEAFNR